MALFLPLLFPQSGSALAKLALRGAGVLTVPAILVLAAVARLSLSGRGGEDCLGYTVLAEKSAAGTP